MRLTKYSLAAIVLAQLTQSVSILKHNKKFAQHSNPSKALTKVQVDNVALNQKFEEFGLDAQIDSIPDLELFDQDLDSDDEIEGARATFALTPPPPLSIAVSPPITSTIKPAIIIPTSAPTLTENITKPITQPTKTIVAPPSATVSLGTQPPNITSPVLVTPTPTTVKAAPVVVTTPAPAIKITAPAAPIASPALPVLKATTDPTAPCTCTSNMTCGCGNLQDCGIQFPTTVPQVNIENLKIQQQFQALATESVTADQIVNSASAQNTCGLEIQSNKLCGDIYKMKQFDISGMIKVCEHECISGCEGSRTCNDGRFSMTQQEYTAAPVTTPEAAAAMSSSAEMFAAAARF